jgi:DNA invertase Pin-like site-specific DNA recombinase
LSRGQRNETGILPGQHPDQNLAQQRDALRKAGCERIFEDGGAGAKEDRAELARLLDMARPGDTIVIWKLDRLARSITHLIKIAGDLKTRGIDFCSLTDSIDTSTASGELHFHMLAALAQFERGLIRERVNAGLETARAAGRIGGRPKVEQAKIDFAMGEVSRGSSVSEAARAAGVSRSTLYRQCAVPKTTKKKVNGHRSFETSFETVSRGVKTLDVRVTTLQQ